MDQKENTDRKKQDFAVSYAIENTMRGGGPDPRMTVEMPDRVLSLPAAVFAVMHSVYAGREPENPLQGAASPHEITFGVVCHDDEAPTVALLAQEYNDSAQAENPSIETRDQFQGDQTLPDNPHIAPGWNAIMVRDIISGMFAAEAAARESENKEGDEDYDYTAETPEITDAEMEQIAPGIIQQVTETVDAHFPSDQMYLAMYAEVRELAQTVVTHMNPEHREALLNAARKKVREARAGKENG